MALSLSDFHLRELELFVMAANAQSLREASRQSGLLPAHASKIIKKLEQKVGHPLFRRSASGVILTPEGISFLETASRICEISRGLGSSAVAPRQNEKLWTVGSISFLTTYLLAPRVSTWRRELRNSRFRLIEFTHNDLVAHGLKGAFEVAVHIEELEWTHAWQMYPLGKFHWKLYGRKDHPLGTTCKESEVPKYSFVVPTDWSSHGYELGEDFCPLSVHARKRGEEAATAETALEICRQSDQLTFIPEILAKRWTGGQGGLQEIQVEGWPSVQKKVFLSVKTDVVPKRLVDVLLKSIGA